MFCLIKKFEISKLFSFNIKTMKQLFIISAFFCFFISISTKSSAQSAVLGAELIKLGDQLQQAIDDAKNAGLSLEVQAGREVALSLENFKNVYASSLNLTMTRLDTTAAKQFESLKSMVGQVQNNTVASLTDFTSQAQQIINALPFRKHEPQLRATTPQFIVPASVAYDVVITCKGNFEAAGLPDYAPTLTINNKVYKSSGTNQQLEFHVPIGELTSDPLISDNKFGYIKASLQIPWKDVVFIFTKKRTDNYLLYIGTLPKQPGTITLVHTITNPRHNQHQFVSPQYYQSSGGDGANDDHKDVPYLVTPTSGWHVQRNTSRLVSDWQTGDLGGSFVSDDADRVVYKMTTIHHGPFGTSGQIRFHITFNEYMDDTFPTYNNEIITLNWGDSKIFDYGVGTWKIIFKAFDGTTQEYSGTENTNPFMSINTSGMGYLISTANPRTLVWQQ